MLLSHLPFKCLAVRGEYIYIYILSQSSGFNAYCVPGSIPPGILYGLSLLSVLACPEGFSPGTPVISPYLNIVIFIYQKNLGLKVWFMIGISLHFSFQPSTLKMKNKFVFTASLLGRMLDRVSLERLQFMLYCTFIDLCEARAYLIYISFYCFFFRYLGVTLDLVELLILIRITALGEMPVILIDISLDLITFTSTRLAWYLFDK